MMILINNQLDALYSMYLFHFPTCLEQHRHTRQSPTQNDIYQMMY